MSTKIIMADISNYRHFPKRLPEFGLVIIVHVLILTFGLITPCSSTTTSEPAPGDKANGSAGNIVKIESNKTSVEELPDGTADEGDEELSDGTAEEEDGDVDGNVAPLSESQKLIPLFKLSNDPNDVKFYLYRSISNPNKSEELLLNDTNSVADSNFDKREKTVFLIHGFLSNSTSGMPSVIRKGFMDANSSYNIIAVDWGKLSTPNPNNPLYAPMSYPIIVRKNIPKVYQRVGEFIQFLINKKFTSLRKLHVIGHSLGAHVSGGVGGVIAENPKNKGRKIARVSGLDPAGPLFQGIQVQRRITKEDAEFVDIYHTAAGTLGTLIYDEGHANFLANGGHHQPGCVDIGQPLFEAQGGSCSHSFVNHIYAASLQNNFTACLCDPQFYDYILGTSCPGDCAVSVLAGDPCPPDARGQFYFETGEDPSTGEPVATEEPESRSNVESGDNNSIEDLDYGDKFVSNSHSESAVDNNDASTKGYENDA